MLMVLLSTKAKRDYSSSSPSTTERPHTARRVTLGGADRFSSSRQAVRFAGLDITVHSSDTKRGPGHLSRQGPPVLRWCLYEAGKASARTHAPQYAYYAAVKERIDGNRAALAQARRLLRHACHLLTTLGDDAFTLTTDTTPAKVRARATHALPFAA